MADSSTEDLKPNVGVEGEKCVVRRGEDPSLSELKTVLAVTDDLFHSPHRPFHLSN